MDINNILSIVAIVVSISGLILGVINHKKITSRCNDKKIIISLDVDDTKDLNIPLITPPK
jgi:hypothetical protein